MLGSFCPSTFRIGKISLNIPNENSDIDLLVKYGINCRGLNRIKFMNDLEMQLKKEVDVINIDFAPEFITTLDLTDEGRKIYER